LTFDVLTDDGVCYAKKLEIAWKISDYAVEWHERYFALNFERHNGAGNRDELPVPATYVVDGSGVVSWRFLEAAYWRRAEPKDVVKAVRRTTAGSQPASRPASVS
jgi:hypothetical protein